MSRNRWYWVIQITAWSTYGVVGLLISGLFSEINLPNIGLVVLGAAMMLTSTHLLRLWMKRRKWLKLRLKALIVRLLPTLVILAVTANALGTIYTYAFTTIAPKNEFSIPIFLLYTLQTFIYQSLWTGIYLIIYYFRNYKKEEIEKWKLQTALKDAELIALKAQINPHFLFNALNNIRALILEDQMKARDMVSHLSELLRYSIQFNNNEKVMVADELDIVQKYLELEAIHYEKRLHFTINSSSDLDRYKIPPMIIQLMAENAVKHGISQVKGGGEIQVIVESQEGELVLQVCNTGKLKPNNHNGGIGLRNATERIRILFEKEPDLQLIQDDDMVKSVLKLPLEK